MIRAIQLTIFIGVVAVLSVILFKTVDMGGFNLWYLHDKTYSIQKQDPLAQLKLRCQSEWCY